MTITIYSKTNCVYCTKAKALLKGLNLEFTEKTLEEDFNGDAKKLIEDIGKPVRTMPQIKVDGKYLNIDEFPNLNKKVKHDISIVVDRIIINTTLGNRLLNLSKQRLI